MISHPAFSPLRPELDNDVAILVLKNNVPDDRSYVCLPEGTYSPSTLVGKRTFVMGNNIDKTGHRHLEIRENLNVSMVPMPVMSNEDCQKIYNGTSIVLHTSHLCAAS
ncbi:hypothetical protein B566_EDAN012158, partial [Ephemera danica]